mmetsp:Transcript_3097/g.12587  ORF Transcript_3097/g.12587 Transcript_3097/m.12587 type:complete len:207 (-) Transcript_3097:359-979(-)
MYCRWPAMAAIVRAGAVSWQHSACARCFWSTTALSRRPSASAFRIRDAGPSLCAPAPSVGAVAHSPFSSPVPSPAVTPSTCSCENSTPTLEPTSPPAPRTKRRPPREMPTATCDDSALSLSTTTATRPTLSGSTRYVRTGAVRASLSSSMRSLGGSGSPTGTSCVMSTRPGWPVRSSAIRLATNERYGMPFAPASAPGGFLRVSFT